MAEQDKTKERRQSQEAKEGASVDPSEGPSQKGIFRLKNKNKNKQSRQESVKKRKTTRQVTGGVESVHLCPQSALCSAAC